MDKNYTGDMTGKTCFKCEKGKYKETSVHDDLDGKLHCDKCGHSTKKWRAKVIETMAYKGTLLKG